MRKIAGAVTAVVLAFVAIVALSKALFVTNAVGMGVPHETDGRVAEPSAAIQVAHRFPAGGEVFRTLDIARPPYHAGNVATDSFAQTGGRQHIPLAGCGELFSPHSTNDCLGGTQAKPAQPLSRPVPVARQAAAVPAEPVRQTVAAAPVERRATPVAVEQERAPVTTAAPASCAQTLPGANARVERVIARVKDSRGRKGAEACAAYRSDFFDVVQAREVTSLCKSGAERVRDLGRIDSAVEDINVAIATSCGGA